MKTGSTSDSDSADRGFGFEFRLGPTREYVDGPFNPSII